MIIRSSSKRDLKRSISAIERTIGPQAALSGACCSTLLYSSRVESSPLVASPPTVRRLRSQ